MLLTCIIIFSSSFLICFYILPILIKFAHKYQIYDIATDLKKHNQNVSFLGGTAIILAMMIPMNLLIPDAIERPKYISALFLILGLSYLQGIDDDIFNRRPNIKFLTQVIISGLLVYFTGFTLTLNSLFSPYYFSPITIFIITLLFTVAIVNAYNLIDGSDGLAASISLIAGIFFVICFYQDNNYYFMAIAISLIAVMIAFLCYNKPPAHIYMGDSGSLFVGLLLATFALVFINSVHLNLSKNISNRIILCFSFMSIPILDMTRLFAFRLYYRVNPFKGDNNHIHHLMKQAGFTAKQTVLIILMLLMLNVGFAFIALQNSWIGFILINISFYILLIQGLRQLNTFLSKKGINLSNTTDNLESIPYDKIDTA